MSACSGDRERDTAKPPGRLRPGDGPSPDGSTGGPPYYTPSGRAEEPGRGRRRGEVGGLCRGEGPPGGTGRRPWPAGPSFPTLTPMSSIPAAFPFPGTSSCRAVDRERAERVAEG